MASSPFPLVCNESHECNAKIRSLLGHVDFFTSILYLTSFVFYIEIHVRMRIPWRRIYSLHAVWSINVWTVLHIHVESEWRTNHRMIFGYNLSHEKFNTLPTIWQLRPGPYYVVAQRMYCHKRRLARHACINAPCCDPDGSSCFCMTEDVSGFE